MSRARAIAIIGCGAIGSSLARAVSRKFPGEVKVCALFDTDMEKARALSRELCGTSRLAKRSLRQAVQGASLVIESASAAGSWDIARCAVQEGRDVLVMSVGGILAHASRLEALAAKKGVRVFIPSGAVAGIDALKGCQGTSIKSVTLTTRKSPRSFSGNQYLASKGIRPEALTRETVLFEGNAQEAVKRFPQNVNVAAVVSLAGIGAARTRVKIIADPSVKNNHHEVAVESKAGRVTCRTENVLHPDNPKTSYLAVLSAMAAIRQAVRPLKVG